MAKYKKGTQLIHRYYLGDTVPRFRVIKHLRQGYYRLVNTCTMTVWTTKGPVPPGGRVTLHSNSIRCDFEPREMTKIRLLQGLQA